MGSSSVAAYLAAVDAELVQRDAERLKGSLLEFVREFWSVVEPGVDFAENWHIHTICEHLEAVREGLIKNLLINVPPGTSKSTLVSVMFPAWCWAQDASLRFFGVSYSEALSIRDALLCRDIITSDRYIELFPNVQLKADSNQKTHYGLSEGGWRLATSVGGRGTGMHPHYKIVDDPHNVKQSESDVERENALSWFDGTLSSRGLILNAATIVIMQRLHQKDLTGHIMGTEGYVNWDHIIVPMRLELQRKMPRTTVKFKDPRTEEGELMWPALFTESKVRKLESSLGEYRTAGQLQQRPAPAGGGILKVDHFQLWPARKPLPDFFYILQSYDTAFTEQTKNDPTACTVWGIFMRGDVRCALLLDAWSEFISYPDMRKRLMEDWKAKYGGVKDAKGNADVNHPPRRVDQLLIEDKGSGIAVIQELRRANVPVHAYNPGNAGKTARAHIASDTLEADVLYVLESKRDAGKPITWARAALQQCEEFPNGEHDDYVDTVTQACIFLTQAELLPSTFVEDDPIEEVDYHAEKKKRRNPYG